MSININIIGKTQKVNIYYNITVNVRNDNLSRHHFKGVVQLASTRAVAYVGPGVVEVRDIGYTDLVLRDGPEVNTLNVGRKCNHGVILTVVATNICGSYQHMVRGRTTAPSGLVLGHEITGEVIEVGRDV